MSKVIQFNLKGGFEVVPEGNRILEVIDVKITPSGNPEKIAITMKDSEKGQDTSDKIPFLGDNKNILLGIIFLDIKYRGEIWI